MSHGIDSAIAGLDGVARAYFERARSLVEAFLEGPMQPFLGYRPDIQRENWDDEDLNRHLALVLKTRYVLDTLLAVPGNLSDVDGAMRHIERVVANTNGLRGPIGATAPEILSQYSWLSMMAGRSTDGLALVDPHISKAPTPRSEIRRFTQPRNYVLLLSMVARYAAGHDAFANAARRSLRNLLAVHTDWENHNYLTCWRGSTYGFDWAWLWERVFCAQPSVQRAIERLRGWHSDDDPR